MKKVTFISIAALAVSCAGPTHLYTGPQKGKGDLGHYSLTGSAGFFTDSMAYTLKIDELDLYNTDKKVWGQVYLEPGAHTVTLSFINYDWKVIPLADVEQNYFKGEYVINFDVRPGI